MALTGKFVQLFAVVALFAISSEAQQLINVKKLPTKINSDMCHCAFAWNTPDRDARRKAAETHCSEELKLSIPDYHEEALTEVKKKMPRGIGNWARKQVQTEGVDYACINKLREHYYYASKLAKWMEANVSNQTRDDYGICFAKQMKWLTPEAELDKLFIKSEISTMSAMPETVRKSMEVLSLTCRGKTYDDVESYARCALKPCFDSEFLDTLKKNGNKLDITEHGGTSPGDTGTGPAEPLP